MTLIPGKNKHGFPMKSAGNPGKSGPESRKTELRQNPELFLISPLAWVGLLTTFVTFVTFMQKVK